MVYRFQDRLRHVSNRMREVNDEPLVYIIDGYTQFNCMGSPILISPDEMDPNNVSVTMIERQDFAIDRLQLGPHYPPANGHKIRRNTGEEFLVSSMGSEEPPYVHTTSLRERVIVHTIRVRKEDDTYT